MRREALHVTYLYGVPLPRFNLETACFSFPINRDPRPGPSLNRLDLKIRGGSRLNRQTMRFLKKG